MHTHRGEHDSAERDTTAGKHRRSKPHCSTAHSDRDGSGAYSHGHADGNGSANVDGYAPADVYGNTRANRYSHTALAGDRLPEAGCPRRNSNPCRGLERAVS